MIFPFCALGIVLRIGVFDLQKQDLVEGAKPQMNVSTFEIFCDRYLSNK